MRRVVLVLAVMALALLLASGVAMAVNKIGTNGPDTLRGTNGDDKLVGRGGNDILLALAGNDNLLGGPGKDIVNGGSLARPFGGDKNLVGGRGNDAVQGGKDSDNIVGGAGNDFVVDGPTREFVTDKLSAGEGNDVVAVFNDPAFKDLVSCGGGFDRVFADRKDSLAPDCERVADSGPEFERLFRSIERSGFFEGLHPQF
jgi:Ca2+-binding RTX toxin-like protein